MAPKPTGAAAPCHAPFSRVELFAVRLTRDPDDAYANVARILTDATDAHDALAECSDWLDGFGVESLTLADGAECLYVNKGDTYDATLCHVDGRGYFVASWGDVYEASDRDHEAETGERRCAYCSEWSEPGEACDSCGRDPETGEPIPDPLRHVELETGHTLTTWDTGKLCAGRTVVGYELCDPDGERIFLGADFRPSPLHADDSDATLRALLGFLTLRPGDTDADYFDGYTDVQRAFAESSDCELLGWLYSDEGPGSFEDIDDEGDAR